MSDASRLLQAFSMAPPPLEMYELINGCKPEALKELLLCCTRNQDRITENMLKNPKWG